MPPKESFSLPYSEKLHSQKDFKRVFDSGARFENRIVKIIVFENLENQVSRIGLVTSRKVGKAAIRNKTKRRIREIFRTNKHSIKQGLDLIFISKRETAAVDFERLKEAVLELFKKAGLYKT
jgi:ribonuclease P protein component